MEDSSSTKGNSSTQPQISSTNGVTQESNKSSAIPSASREQKAADSSVSNDTNTASNRSDDDKGMHDIFLIKINPGINMN